ncbi:uncharacterized protein [Bemisia tabaci]|uniref:uncharacterized protein n=1 Tax=Bemisia tabaci TaxID=7038 RepID=UPI003B28A434
MRSYPTILVLAVCIVGNNRQRSFVQTAPLDAVSDNDKQSFEPSRSGSIINDEAVEELRHLKGNALTSDSTGNGGSISVVKTHSAVFTNMNGKQEGHAEMKEQVNKNGEMFAKVEQKVDAKEDPKAGSPNTHVLTAVDIPSKGIHRVFSSEPGEKNLNLANLPAKATTTKRRVISPATLNRFEGDDTQFPLSQMDGFTKTPLPLNAQYSPLDVAEYVFWTGDEKGVTMAVEEYLKQGLMTREEAISFLQDIQFNLDYLQLHYNSKHFFLSFFLQEKNRQLEKILGLAERYREELQSPHSSADLKDIRAQMRLQNYEKKSDYSSFINDPRTKQAAPTSDEDYEEVLEKLKVADFLYNEYSMEDMVYQLAKVMFTQTLRRSSAEAQEALQKFTDFLESEAEQGRISRTLEKKVLDVLVAALTDTLNEHPELTSAAREGFGRDNSPDSGFSHQSFYRNSNSMSSKSSEKSSLAESPKSLQKGKVHETSAKKPLDMVMKKRNIHTSGIEDGEKV